jgi:hypothetical protein
MKIDAGGFIGEEIEQLSGISIQGREFSTVGGWKIEVP